MNPNFEDAWYHLRWAARHLTRGLREELGPVVRDLRRRVADDPSRVERVRRRVRSVEPRRVASRARERISR
ncbi:MAG: hypothetical protein ABEJ43_05845 [Haloferacaceae archaeon]